jgi:LysM repeat protein
MRKRSVILGFLVLMCLLVVEVGPVSAQASSATELITAVNQLRSFHGLAALQVDSSLMSAAQSHSEYQASIGDVTHTGAGGSQPMDRATDAGYGGGETFFLSENVAGGTNLSAAQVVSWWQADALHLNTMLNANAQHIGAGVAVVDGFVYYTLIVGYISAQTSLNPAQITPNPPTRTPGLTPDPANVVELATPGEDGAIIHIVRSGQTLITIADAYGVDLNDMLELNGLTGDSVIFPGDELLIQAGFTATPTSLPTTTATQTIVPTSTRRPTLTPLPPAEASREASLVVQTQAMLTPTLETAQPKSDSVGNVLLLAIAVLGVGGILMIIVGGWLRRSSSGVSSYTEEP